MTRCGWCGIRQVAPADVRARDDAGKTVAHYCASRCNAQVLELVAARDRSALDAPDNGGHTPLHDAVIAGNVGAVESLLDHGVDINARDHERHSAAHWAVGVYSLLRDVNKTNFLRPRPRPPADIIFSTPVPV